MALFARRTLQRILDENARFLTPKQVAGACNLLNTAHDNYLAREWEQVILNAASKHGTVRHEAQLGTGTSRLDLLFKSHDGQLEFAADVTVASDEGFHAFNPVDAFEQELWRIIRKMGWDKGGFHVEIDPQTTNISRGLVERIQLKLPPRSEWKGKVFNSDFTTFLRQVRGEPDKKHRFDAVSSDMGVHITYDPARRGTFGSHHLVYTLATTIDRNPVHTALKSKGDQIKKSGYQGVTGIFLCDGGCNMLTAQPHWSSFSTDQVVQSFFRQFSSTWFIVIFGVKASGSDVSVHPKLFLSPRRRAYDFARLTQIVDSIYKSIPKLQLSAYNARYCVKAGDLAGKYYGRLTSGGQVEMSAREMLEILAGVKTVAEFEQSYRLDPASNPFRQALEEGRLISKATVEHLPERDDDKMTIEFGPPDAAIAAFRAKTP